MKNFVKVEKNCQIFELSILIWTFSLMYVLCVCVYEKKLSQKNQQQQKKMNE